MENEKEFRDALQQGLTNVSTVLRIYVDTHHLNEDEIQEVSKVTVDELRKNVNTIMEMPDNEFKRLALIETAGAMAFEEAAIKAMKKDGKPSGMVN